MLEQVMYHKYKTTMYTSKTGLLLTSHRKHEEEILLFSILTLQFPLLAQRLIVRADYSWLVAC